jgi:hypothetical protein
MPLSNDERRRVLDRLGPPLPIVGLHVTGGDASSAVMLHDWTVNVWDSGDDREYTCANCGAVLRARGVVVEGTFACCGQRVFGYKPAPPRRRGHPKP